MVQSDAKSSTVSPANAIDGDAENQDFVRARAANPGTAHMDSSLDTLWTIRSELWSAVSKAFLGRIMLLEEDAMENENAGKTINATTSRRPTRPYCFRTNYVAQNE